MIQAVSDETFLVELTLDQENVTTTDIRSVEVISNSNTYYGNVIPLTKEKKKNFDLAPSSSHKNIKQTVSVFCAPHSKTPASWFRWFVSSDDSPSYQYYLLRWRVSLDIVGSTFFSLFFVEKEMYPNNPCWSKVEGLTCNFESPRTNLTM